MVAVTIQEYNMTISIKKYLFMISFISLLSILILVLLLPSIGLMVSVTFIFFSFIMASSHILKRNRDGYLRGKITRGVFLHYTSLEIFCILLGMTLAGLLGRYLAEVATAQIANELIRNLAGILVGLLVGAGVGWLMQRVRGGLVKA
jgi:hypothetical protein